MYLFLFFFKYILKYDSIFFRMILRITVFVAFFFYVFQNSIKDRCEKYTNIDIRRTYPAVTRTSCADVASTDRECIFLSSRHFGIRRHVFARPTEPRVFTDAGEPFPREFRK